MVRCTRCDLALTRTQVVPGSGNPDARVMFLGEAPGAREDERGVPFVGRSGELLDRMLDQAGLDRHRVFIGNVVRCRPPANRDPKGPEIEACAGWLEQQLRLIAPSMVATLGRFALQHFVPGARITRLQGTIVQADTAFGALRIFPLLHPAAVLRNPRLQEGYAEHFRRLAAHLEQ